MPETSKSKRYEALCFKRSLEVADLIISQRAILYEQRGLSSRQETRKRREEGGKRRNLLSFFKVHETNLPGVIRFEKKQMRNECLRPSSPILLQHGSRTLRDLPRGDERANCSAEQKEEQLGEESREQRTAKQTEANILIKTGRLIPSRTYLHIRTLILLF
jgi:hypothetical protein